MNTQAEMDMTIEDYHYGNNGFEWQSIRIYNDRRITIITIL